jgi:lipopolysaccharide transport system permease protein
MKDAIAVTPSDRSLNMETSSLNDPLGVKKYPVFRIEPTSGWTALKLKEIWEYRELLGIFVWRDLKVRYRQTIIGALWAIVQPFLTMVIFSVFFGRLAGVPSDSIPYPIFSYAALVPWTFFANSINQASNSLVNNAEMIKKIYFPRLTMPFASMLAGLVDFVLAFIILIGMMLYYGFVPTINILWFPLFLLLSMMTALGVSLWLSAMNVQFRDVRYMIPFITQAWLFATPVAYPSSMLSEPWRTLYGINPMVGVVEGFRWALLGTDTAPGPMMIVSFAVASLILISGVYYFRRMEKNFADVI